MELAGKSYKDLQLLCKQYKLKAIGNYETLSARLLDYATSSSKKKTQSFIDEITEGLEDLDSTYVMQEIDSRKVYYKTIEAKMVFNLAICFTEYIQKHDYKCRTLYPIITEYQSKVKNCKFPLERKLLFLNAISSLFFREIKENEKTQNPEEVIEELLDGGRQTLRELGFLS